MFDILGPYLEEERILTDKDLIKSERRYRFDNDLGAIVTEYSEMMGEYDIQLIKYTKHDVYVKIDLSHMNLKHVFYSPDKTEDILKKIMKIRPF